MTDDTDENTGTAGEPFHPISFAEAEERNPRIRRLGDEVRRALLNPAVWLVCAPYLYGTAKTGSTQYNHANVVREVREWDRKANHSHIANYDLSDKALWNVVYRELGHVFKVQRGMIVDVLEYKKDQPAAA
jgi:hypothetical protein